MKLVNYQVHDDVAEITLDHPPVNALSEPMIDELLSSLARAAADRLLRAVILGSDVPRRFCAGLDLDLVNRSTGAQLHDLVEKLYVRLCDAQFSLGKPRGERR